MFKKHIIFQILSIIVAPLCSAFLKLIWMFVIFIFMVVMLFSFFVDM